MVTFLSESVRNVWAIQSQISLALAFRTIPSTILIAPLIALTFGAFSDCTSKGLEASADFCRQLLAILSRAEFTGSCFDGRDKIVELK